MAQPIPPHGDRPASLEARPKAEALSVERLMQDVGQGRIRVPEFQRDLAWDAEDARKLIDSVYRGYPVGTTIFWKRPAPAANLQFGSLSIVAPERQDALWVVDGQQRITSLARLLLPAEPGTDEFSAYFDLDQNQFVSVRQAKSAKDPARFLPLTEVLDSIRLQLWVSARALDERRMKSAFRLGSRIREYSIPTYVVETPDEAALREMFGRLNSSGKALKAADVFNALHGVRGDTSARDLRDVSRELSRLDFGELEEPLIFKVLLAILGRDVVGSDVPRLAESDATEAFEQTISALQATVAFLKRDAEIPHESLLPYRQPLVALGKYFHLHPEPSARSRELLTRWLWRGAWSAHHSGDVVSTRRVLDLISTDDEDTVQGLLREIGPSKPVYDLGPFNFRHAQSKLEVLALLSLKPRNVLTGEPIRVTRDFAGAEYISRLFDATVPLARTIANRVLHPQTAQLAGMLRLTTEEQILESHGIGPAAREALKAHSEDSFLQIRAKDLARRFQVFFESKAKYGANDRPSVASLIVSEEED